MVNVTKVLDVTDYSKAKFVKFSNSEKILAFQKYSFRMCDDLQNNDIFYDIKEQNMDKY